MQLQIHTLADIIMLSMCLFKLFRLKIKGALKLIRWAFEIDPVF